MELLIYNKEHWMDSLTQEEITEQSKTNEHFMEKYNSRYQRGDIVEVREDGYWDQRGFNKNAFAVVRVEGINPEKYLMEPQMNGDSIIKRRKYNVNTDRVTFNGEQKSIVTTLNEAEIIDKETNIKETNIKLIG